MVVNESNIPTKQIWTILQQWTPRTLSCIDTSLTWITYSVVDLEIEVGSLNLLLGLDLQYFCIYLTYHAQICPNYTLKAHSVTHTTLDQKMKKTNVRRMTNSI